MAERFDCESCSESLFGRKFIDVDHRAHCVPCYDRLFAHSCHECQELIGHDAKELLYDERHYHEHCLRCCRCSRALAEETFSRQDQGPVCSDCFCHEFCSKCTACDQNIEPGSRTLEYGGSVWHHGCFSCDGCGSSLGAQAFVPDAHTFFCVPCYEGKLAPRCHHCHQALTRGGVTYKDRVWHRDCFLCSRCKTPLSGQSFTCQGEEPYCVKCFSHLYAHKCSGCNSAITGFGDGKYVAFEERQWHPPCFKCSRCSVSLLGSGFFPDRDLILCSDCNSED